MTGEKGKWFKDPKWTKWHHVNTWVDKRRCYWNSHAVPVYPYEHRAKAPRRANRCKRCVAALKKETSRSA